MKDIHSVFLHEVVSILKKKAGFADKNEWVVLTARISQLQIGSSTLLHLKTLPSWSVSFLRSPTTIGTQFSLLISRWTLNTLYYPHFSSNWYWKKYIQAPQPGQPTRLATAGSDTHVVIWGVKKEQGEEKVELYCLCDLTRWFFLIKVQLNVYNFG